MEGTGRADVRRRVRIQAIAVAVLVSVYGIGASVLGAPVWIAVLWLRFRRRPPAPVPMRAEEPVPAKEPAQEESERRLRAIGYVCVPSTSNGDLSHQTAAVQACCDEHGFDVASIVHDVEYVGRDQRPSLIWALEQLANGEAQVLVVARLRDLSSNVANLAPLLSWFESDRRRLVAIDLELDTSTEAGRLAARAIAGVGGWEHERISERTRRGLEAARSRGNGQGRSAVADNPELQERIATMREEGMTLQAIADVLNAEGVPTLRGGTMWRPSSVQRTAGYRRPTTASAGIELPRRSA